MRVFMTGATGFIGKSVVLRLQRDGHEVLAWVRSPQRACTQLGADVELVAASTGVTGLRQAVERADAVINLAGESIARGRFTTRRRDALVNSRVGVTEMLAGAIRAARKKPEVLVSASAVGIYGDRGDELIDEYSAPGQGFVTDLCRRWEEAALDAADSTRVAIVRIGLVLGPGGGALHAMLPAFRMGLGGALGSGRQYLPWIHILDMAEIVASALTDQRFAGVIHAVAPRPATSRELAVALARELGRPNLMRVPAPLLRLALGEASALVTASQRAVPGFLMEHGFVFAFSRLQDALGDILGKERRVIITSVDNVPESAYLQSRPPRYLLGDKITVHAPLDQVFDFFSRAENLALITPPSMKFELLSPMPITMARDTTIDYRIRLGPLPMRWRTVIEAWDPPHKFVDSQHRGPYRAWWHEHHFAGMGERTEIADRVYYAPPLGFAGAVANPMFVAPMLRAIFGYRSAALELRFGRPFAQDAAAAREGGSAGRSAWFENLH